MPECTCIRCGCEIDSDGWEYCDSCAYDAACQDREAGDDV